MASQPCIYRHFDAEGNLLYVGSSMRVLTRQLSHAGSAKWFDQVATISIERFATREEMLLAEKAAIVAECPVHNIRDAIDSDGRPRVLRQMRTYPPPSPEFLARVADLATRLNAVSGGKKELTKLSKRAFVSVATMEKIKRGYVPTFRTVDTLAAYFKKADKRAAKEGA